MYAVWKAVNRTVPKVLMKILALAALIALTIFTVLFKIFLFLFRFAALPCGAIGVIAAIFYYFESGLCREFYWIVAGVVATAAAYFSFPLIPPALDALKDYLKDYVAEPLFIRSPVKYTM